MEAPNVIFVDDLAVVNDSVTKISLKRLPNFSEYIRKNALMNYFNKRVEKLNSPLNGVLGSTEREHCNERISELLLLIDTLNSM